MQNRRFQFSFFSPQIRCEDAMIPHLQKIFDGEYDIPYYPKKDLVILDIGANVGTFSLWASYRWPGSMVHAYEPNPALKETLIDNTKSFKVKIHPVAIGNPGKLGYRFLYAGANNSGEATLHQNPTSTNDGAFVDVKDPTFLPYADILKIDAEGSEIEILRPLIKMGRKFDAIMIEFHTESYRREIDKILIDYVLISAGINPNPHLGVVKYMHREIYRGIL